MRRRLFLRGLGNDNKKWNTIITIKYFFKLMQFQYFLTSNEDVAAALQMEAGCNYYDHFFVIDLIRRGISFLLFL